MIKMLETTVKFIESLGPYHPKIGIVLGSGLGNFIQSFSEKISVPYSRIPHFQNVSVAGHNGQLVLGKINGIEIIALQGRVHAYEGHSQAEVVYPIRTLGLLGVENLILTNVSGGINKSFFPGDFVLTEDHLNLTGKNPLIGPNLFDFAPRFPDMSKAYDPSLNEMLTQSAKELNIPLKSGVYAGVLGPSYETPAEVRMLRALGADMVGMSTVPETIAAHHMGVKVCNISLISNMAAGIIDDSLRHEDITLQAASVMEDFSSLIKNFIIKIGVGSERGH
ncbi:MAG: purine-nucleoside phosphorylase [Epsilonproteobacteria bacterium]|nr:MAG: purine-nucleoside phosphorylase [Campylobacterota bacterium]RLA66880.1 MAG: purine-nucleoside phosphorylase [Campylobacterota bacterium]